MVGLKNPVGDVPQRVIIKDILFKGVLGLIFMVLLFVIALFLRQRAGL